MGILLGYGAALLYHPGVMDSMVKVEETIRRLRDKAEHPATPAGEAETCNRIATKLELKHGVKTTRPPVNKPQSAPAAAPKAATITPERDEAVINARSNALGRAYQTFGMSFDPQLWSRAYDRAVQAQRTAGIKFDTHLAYEHALEQYNLPQEPEVSEPVPTVDPTFHGLSDLEVAMEISRLAHVLLDLQWKLSAIKEGGSRPAIFGRPGTLKTTTITRSNLDLQYESTMQNFRRLEGELATRVRPVQAPSAPAEEVPKFRFFANPASV